MTLPGWCIRRPHEHVLAIYSPAGRDNPADLGSGACGNAGLYTASGIAAAAGGLSDDTSLSLAAGRKPRNDGFVRRHTSRTSVRTHRRRHGNDLLEQSGIDLHRAAVRPE